jgi:copper chaperone CopZ
VALSLPALTALAAEQQIVEIGIQGMAYEFCVAKMTSKLGKLPGVEKVDVSLKQKRARVE